MNPEDNSEHFTAPDTSNATGFFDDYSHLRLSYYQLRGRNCIFDDTTNTEIDLSLLDGLSNDNSVDTLENKPQTATIDLNHNFRINDTNSIDLAEDSIQESLNDNSIGTLENKPKTATINPNHGFRLDATNSIYLVEDSIQESRISPELEWPPKYRSKEIEYFEYDSRSELSKEDGKKPGVVFSWPNVPHPAQVVASMMSSWSRFGFQYSSMSETGVKKKEELEFKPERGQP